MRREKTTLKKVNDFLQMPKCWLLRQLLGFIEYRAKKINQKSLEDLAWVRKTFLPHNCRKLPTSVYHMKRVSVSVGRIPRKVTFLMCSHHFNPLP